MVDLSAEKCNIFRRQHVQFFKGERGEFLGSDQHHRRSKSILQTVYFKLDSRKTIQYDKFKKRHLRVLEGGDGFRRRSTALSIRERIADSLF
jgi:hypothetical protein